MASAGRKAIFITGAASGIGLATARRFASEGWFVGLADINAGGLKSAAAELSPQSCSVHTLDVRDRNGWRNALADFSRSSGGRLDALLNNAGVAHYGFFEDQSDEEIDRQFDINLRGVANGARAALPLLKATPGSTLINVASCAGIVGAPRMAAYCATKFAVKGLSEALEAEFSRHGIAVRCIMPWFVDTPILQAGSQGSNEKMADRLRAGGAEVYSVEEAADVIWRSIHGRDLNWIVGKAGRRLALAARFLPGSVRKRAREGLSQ
jgi:NAD(P)-dependent dehydrogenase (short-subunit alcohol dehydrogenase family)